MTQEEKEAYTHVLLSGLLAMHIARALLTTKPELCAIVDQQIQVMYRTFQELQKTDCDDDIIQVLCQEGKRIGDKLKGYKK